MRILVTGHKGYIGTVMVPMLLGAGHDVVGVDSDLFRQSTFTAGIQDVPELRLDLRDIMPAHLEGFEAVMTTCDGTLRNGAPPAPSTLDETHRNDDSCRRWLKSASFRSNS